LTILRGSTGSEGRMMASNLKKLVFFEKWIDPLAEALIAEEKGIEVIRLTYDAPEEANWRVMEQAHGYQIAPGAELREPWYGSRELLAACRNLLAISTPGVGYDIIDVPACTEAGVLVVNQDGANSEAVAEHALGLMLALSKKIVIADRALRRPGKLDRFQFTGNELFGKTVGIVGFGNIGSSLGRLCKVFDMTVLAYDPYLSEDAVRRRGGRKVPLEALLRVADFVSLNCPLNDTSAGMIGRDQLALMKPTAYFVTTARGGIHKEDDLAEALAARRIAGAGLDVFLDEPPAQDNPLLWLDNVIATPHNAGLTAEAKQSMARSAVRQWVSLFSGGPPRAPVNPEVWDRYADRFERLFGIRPHEAVTDSLQ
jgi:D-3-phosphoglycerate dehydrogenase